MKDMTEFLERKERSGNGFGGEEGLQVLDSKLKSSKRYFWLDNENLLLRTDFSVSSPKDVQRNYVWNTERNSIKPLELEGPVICLLDEKLYYTKPSEAKALPNGNLKGQVYQSEMREVDEKWIVESSHKIESIWVAPSEGYDLYWSDGCYPHFQETPSSRARNGNSFHRVKFASEWGWILRVPRVPPTNPISQIPKIGLYDLDGEAYFGQSGSKVTELSQSLIKDITNLHFVYVGFLDKYLIANKPYGDRTKSKILELLDRNGKLQQVSALDDWPTYGDIPLPTRKGIFWTGKDYRSRNPLTKDAGIFVKVSDGQIHKVAGGEAFKGALSKDGCSVAFYNIAEYGKRRASLKVFRVCNSTLDGKELPNVDY